MLKNIINKPKVARLIPSFSDSEKEQKATSILLSCFSIVPDFAKDVLIDAGAPITKRSSLSCYIEVVFKNGNKPNKKSRPDGLIIVKTGNKIWSAIFEAKIGNNNLDKDQIEEYLDIAKANGVNAVITISNQYATIPTHNPVQVSKQKIKSIELFHFSWLALQTKANLLIKNKSIGDREQAIVLSEFIQYLKDDRSGVTSFTQMGRGWREVSLSVNKGIKLKKSDPFVEEAISSWQQFSKYLAIQLSENVGQPVYEYISRTRKNDSIINYQVNLEDLTTNNYLDVEFEIPNAASRLHMIADFKTRTVTIEMSLNAPQDRKYPQSCITWITRQIPQMKDTDIEIRANWSRGKTEMKKISEIYDDVVLLIPKGTKDLPKTLDVVEIIDLAGRFASSKPFVEETSKAIINYYNKIGQNLWNWTPKPLKGKQTSNEKGLKPSIVDQTVNPFWIPPKNTIDTNK